MTAQTYPKNLAQLKKYMTAGRVVYVSYSLARTRAGLEPQISPRVPLAIARAGSVDFEWDDLAPEISEVWPNFTAGKGRVHHRWGKAADYRILPHGVAYEPADMGGKQIMFYHFTPEPPATRTGPFLGLPATTPPEETPAPVEEPAEETPAPDRLAPVGAEIYRSPLTHEIYARIYTRERRPLAIIGPYHSHAEAAAHAYADHHVLSFTTGGKQVKIGAHLAHVADILTVSVKRGETWSTISWAKDEEHARRIRDNHRKHDAYKGTDYRIT